MEMEKGEGEFERKADGDIAEGKVEKKLNLRRSTDSSSTEEEGE